MPPRALRGPIATICGTLTGARGERDPRRLFAVDTRVSRGRVDASRRAERQSAIAAQGREDVGHPFCGRARPDGRNERAVPATAEVRGRWPVRRRPASWRQAAQLTAARSALPAQTGRPGTRRGAGVHSHRTSGFRRLELHPTPRAERSRSIVRLVRRSVAFDVLRSTFGRPTSRSIGEAPLKPQDSRRFRQEVSVIRDSEAAGVASAPLRLEPERTFKLP